DDDLAFVRAIREDPLDDARRLVYADWLEERGDIRGEYLRLEVALTGGSLPEEEERDGWERLARLRDAISPRWLALVARTSYSVQGRLRRVRPPRVDVSYPVETGEAARAELPFIIAILADLSGIPVADRPPLRQRRFVPIDRDDLNRVMAAHAPRLRQTVPDRLSDGGGELRVELDFRRLDDFDPGRVAEQVPAMNQLLAERRALLPRVEEADDPTGLRARLGEIDRRLSAQADEILHHPDFRRLEATWRGLFYLVTQSETDFSLQLRVLDVTREELLADLEAGAEPDRAIFGEAERSELFRKVYEETYGTRGGQPFTVLLGDYAFDVRRPDDVRLLRRLAGLAVAAHAPLVAAAGPGSFGMESFEELHRPRDLPRIFDAAEYADWRAFRESAESRYAGLTVPRVLARVPYGRQTRPVVEFDYEEGGAGEPDQLPWMSASWAHAVRLTDALARHRWPARICGSEGGGRAEYLPCFADHSDEAGARVRGPAEVDLNERRETELSRLGFLPLTNERHRVTAAVFRGAPSAHRPADAAAATPLNRLLCALRFAQTMKVWVRDTTDDFAGDREALEERLNAWLREYVAAASEIPEERAGARWPLEDASVRVEDVPGAPGYRRALLRVRPRFQLPGDPADVTVDVILHGPRG
ncbi:MAG TPA: type VI secretion system contractile sheath large subunit, partial [Gemmataceae bacterium]